jgi:hypothetical protein
MSERTARTRFRIEAVLAVVATVFLILTLVWKDWIEIVFGVDPDHGDGSAEWLIAGGAALLAVVFGVLARMDWRRMRTAAA